MGISKRLSELLLKVEHATEANRELDAEIMFDLYAKAVGRNEIDGGPTGYLWPEDNPSWNFGIRFPGKDRQFFTKNRNRVDRETLLIERDGALVLMNALRIPSLFLSFCSLFMFLAAGTIIIGPIPTVLIFVAFVLNEITKQI